MGAEAAPVGIIFDIELYLFFRCDQNLLPEKLHLELCDNLQLISITMKGSISLLMYKYSCSNQKHK